MTTWLRFVLWVHGLFLAGPIYGDGGQYYLKRWPKDERNCGIMVVSPESPAVFLV